jgi:hypothetical protein
MYFSYSTAFQSDYFSIHREYSTLNVQQLYFAKFILRNFSSPLQYGDQLCFKVRMFCVRLDVSPKICEKLREH